MPTKKHKTIKAKINKKYGIITTQHKVSKNYVSYFYAGLKAGLVMSGKYTPEQIEELDYTTTSFKNIALPLYRAYLDETYDDNGLENMYNQLKKSDFEILKSNNLCLNTHQI